MRLIDSYLNRVTMHRLLLVGLGALSVYAVVSGALRPDTLFTPGRLIAGAGVLVLSALAADWLLRRLYKSVPIAESTAITALLLFFIMTPPADAADAAVLAAIAAVAVASKYILALHERHIVNPAAIAAVIAGWAGLGRAAWWVATPVMVVPMVMLGLLVVRKLRRGHMVALYTAVAAGGLLLTLSGFSFAAVARLAFVTSPLLFLGFFMLTEPLTTPPRYRQRLLYAVIVGVGVGLHPSLGPLAVTPELALVLGNIYSYTVSLRRRVRLKLRGSTEIAPGIHEFRFTADRLDYTAGQYVDMVLPLHERDARGNRRSFTIASSPTEKQLLFGIKFPPDASAYKRALLQLPRGYTAYANYRGGDFTLPAQSNRKLLFIAGGIGVTPFRSMCQFIIDTAQQRDAVLLYFVNAADQLVYSDVFRVAAKNGITYIPVISGPGPWTGLRGELSADLLQQQVPDVRERLVYVSGPSGMVQSARHICTSIGIPGRQIRTDYFVGY